MRPRFRWLYPFDYPLLAYLAVGIGCAVWLDREINWQKLLNFRTELYLIGLGGPWVIGLLYGWLLIGRRMSLPEILERLKHHLGESWLHWERWYEVARTVLAFKLYMMVHTSLKSWIPLLNPRLYDRALLEADAWLHFGFEPVEIYRVWMQVPAVSRGIDLLYIVWYSVKLPVMFFFLLHPQAWRRWHFFTAYFLMWVVGGGLAILLPSHGPVYLFPELYANIDMPTATRLQAYLWHNYETLLADAASHETVPYGGIAAFPSLHVGISVLHAVAIRESSRLLFHLFALYAVVIQFGSVALGWHYAVDGYVGGMIAILLYYGLRPWFRGSRIPDKP
jgi:hypothetical protein